MTPGAPTTASAQRRRLREVLGFVARGKEPGFSLCVVTAEPYGQEGCGPCTTMGLNPLSAKPLGDGGSGAVMAPLKSLPGGAAAALVRFGHEGTCPSFLQTLCQCLTIRTQGFPDCVQFLIYPHGILIRSPAPPGAHTSSEHPKAQSRGALRCRTVAHKGGSCGPSQSGGDNPFS